MKETAADEYARLKQERFDAWLESSFSDDALKGIDLFEVKLPSTGMVIKCRKLDAAYTANSGQMPMALSGQIMAAGQNGHVSEAEASKRFAAMSSVEQRSAIQASAQMALYVAVEPRLVIGEVGNRTNAISVDVLTIDDFNCLVKFASGGDAAAGLKTFRSKRK